MKTIKTTFANQDQQNLISKRDQLVVKKMKLDKFFSWYLDKFGSKMKPEKTDTKIWKLYREKLNEYDTISRELKSANYFINKNV